VAAAECGSLGQGGDGILNYFYHREFIALERRLRATGSLAENAKQRERC
jgi:hypothetical protein